MKTAIPASPVPTPPVSGAKTLEERIDDIFREENVAGIWEKGQVPALRTRLIDLCTRGEAAKAGSTDHYLETFRTQIVPRRKQAVRQYTNVQRQIWEARAYELGRDRKEFDTAALMQQMRGQLHGVSRDSQRWVEDRDGYGDSLPPVNWAFVGGTQEEIQSVINRDQPRVHTSIPDSEYRAWRNILHDSRRVVRDGLKKASEAERQFLDSGVVPTEEQLQKVVVPRNEAVHRTGNLLESLGSATQRATRWAGRGLLSHSKASEDPRYGKYLHDRNHLLSQLIWQLGPDSGNRAAYLETLNRVNDILGNDPEGKLIDQASFAKIQALIQDALVKENEAKKKEIEDMNKRILELNKAMLEGPHDGTYASLKGIVKKEDDMWKYQVMQVFLLLTPIGGFSLFGEVFNYMDPLAELFGPIFDSTISLSEGLGKVVKSDALGIFGDVADKLEVDTAVQWLSENLPIVNELFNVYDVVADWEGTAELLGAVSPMVSSPLIPLAILGLYTLWNADEHVTHWSKTRDFLKEQDQKLVKAFEEFRASSDAGLKGRITDFCTKRLDVALAANIQAEAAKFLFEADKEVFGLFGDLEFEIEVGGKTEKKKLQQWRDEGRFKNSRDIMDALLGEQNAASAAEVLKGFLLFGAVKDPAKTPAENIAAYKAAQAKPDADKDKMIAGQQTKITNGFIEDAAKKRAFTTMKKPDERIQDLKRQLIAHEVDKLFDLAKERSPDLPAPSVKRPTAVPLHGGAPLYQTV